MKKLIFYIGLFYAYLTIPTNAQPYRNLKYPPVQKGEKMPDIKLTLENFSESKTIHMSDLRGKVVIFDFWGVNCHPCVKALPKLMELQKKFKNEIQIILVNSESRHFLDSVAKRRLLHSTIYKLPDLAQVNSDSILQHLFPHNSIPHYVWIQPDGSLYANTGDQDVTEENIRSLINHKMVLLYEKNDILDYDDSRPLIPQLYSRQKDPILYYSGVTKWIAGLNGAVNLVSDTVNKIIRISRPPFDLLTLVTDAITRHKEFTSPYSSENFDFGKRVLLYVKDSSRYFYDPSKYARIEDWKALYHYGYEGVFNICEKERIYDNMLADLCRFFQIDVHFEKRIMKGLAIVRTSREDKLKFNIGRDRSNGIVYTDTAGIFHLIGSRMKIFRDRLSAANIEKEYIFFDQTNYEGRIDLEIKSSLSNIAGLRSELQKKYDLDLVETEMEVEVLVIREK